MNGWKSLIPTRHARSCASRGDDKRVTGSALIGVLHPHNVSISAVILIAGQRKEGARRKSRCVQKKVFLHAYDKYDLWTHK